MTDSILGASPSLARIKRAIAKTAIADWTDDDGHKVIEGYLDDIARAVVIALSPAVSKRKASK